MLIEINYMMEEHLDEVAALEKECFSEPWSRDAFGDTLNKDEYIYIVALYEGNVAGYAGAVVSIDEGSITNIAVSDEKRRMGIGKELMLQMTKLLKERNVTQIFLEVRESNEAARELYRLCGYSDVGMRKNFYNKPTENAIVMKLDIN